MKDFRDMKVWQKAHELALAAYKATVNFPKEEMYGLTGQIRRASGSIPANIAEGCGRNGDVELARFLQIAMGSASELEYHMILAKDLGYMAEETHKTMEEDLITVKQMLASFIKKLRAES